METNLCSYHFTILVLVFNGVDLVSSKAIDDFQHQIQIKPNDLHNSTTKTEKFHESMEFHNIFLYICTRLLYIYLHCVSFLKNKTIRQLPPFWKIHIRHRLIEVEKYTLWLLFSGNKWLGRWKMLYNWGIQSQSTSEKYKNLM